MAALRQVAFYGEGGFGKSTTTRNTLAAFQSETISCQ
ncbi:hypothetical protein CN134_36965 [Sinorhizobium meliloti]|nr:hypothetical protein CN134_36965 [Sinorhizobium meliloti]RVO19669.1 hypothetical protein CN098_36095 [Sinorhizobium meliloti]RVO46019.1 hypothetical protein CN092_35165 [Sinorhizobium meliloti]